MLIYYLIIKSNGYLKWSFRNFQNSSTYLRPSTKKYMYITENKKFTNNQKFSKYFSSFGSIALLSSGILFGFIFWKSDNQVIGKRSFIKNAVEESLVNDNSCLNGRRRHFNFISDVVEICAPAVVYIEIKDKKRLDYLTGQPYSVSNGSGFIIESNGLILTNAHVVINKPHTIVQVKLSDGRTYTGLVEDVDQSSDLATLRIRCQNLPKLKLGSSNSLRSGEWVVAIGSPLALSNTVTAGVVSSTQRTSHELGLKGRDINYIQTDTAITFGNSGGPLVNLEGEVIGINSMKVTAGISFAIPIDYVKKFLAKSKEEIKGNTKLKTNHMKRYIGITMLTLTNDILMELKHKTNTIPNHITHGVLIWKVIIGSPAHKGGLNSGDIVTKINGKEIYDSYEIYRILNGEGEILKLTIFRGINEMTIEIKPEHP